ncbi:MAG TPA: hypothetical protein VGN61_06250, partial [Verrucomicrobiae bacterium]
MNGRSIRMAATMCMAFVLLGLEFAESCVFGGTPDSRVRGTITQATNLMQLRNAADGGPGTLVAFSLQGTVLEANSKMGIIVLQDDSGTEMLETTLADQAMFPGQRVSLQGTNFIVPSSFGLDIERRPLIDNDGLHPNFERNGNLYLRKGRYPIQVSWYNYTSFRALSVEYSGPNFARRRIPDSVLFLRSALSDGNLDYTNGLNFRCFEGQWRSLAALQPTVPVKTGVASNFDLTVSTRAEHVALAFDGLIQIDVEGLYNFYLGS